MRNKTMLMLVLQVAKLAPSKAFKGTKLLNNLTQSLISSVSKKPKLPHNKISKKETLKTVDNKNNTHNKDGIDLWVTVNPCTRPKWLTKLANKSSAT